MGTPRNPNDPPPPPDLGAKTGAPMAPHATSVFESRPEREARLAREAAATAAALPAPDPRTPLPAPQSALGEVPSDHLIPLDQAAPTVPVPRAWAPLRRRERIVAPPLAIVEPDPVPPVSTAQTLDYIVVPEPQSPPVALNVTDESATKIVISTIRSATEADKAWALPKRVGTTVPAIYVQDVGWIRYSSVISVMVDSTAQDLRTGRRVVYVTVVFSPDPGDGMMKAKLRSGNKLLHNQLVAGIAAVFSELPPVGKVLRFVTGSPTMTEAEANMAGYTARKVDPDGKLRAPVRAEFSLEEVARREQEVCELYEDMQRDLFQPWIRVVLFWWWCIGFLMPSRHARLAAYKMGEQFSLKSGDGRPSKPAITAPDEKAALISAAELVKGVAASHSSLVWMNPALRAALAEKGVRVEEIAGTRLGTILADGVEISRK